MSAYKQIVTVSEGEEVGLKCFLALDVTHYQSQPCRTGYTDKMP